MPLCLERGDGTSIAFGPLSFAAETQEFLLPIAEGSSTVRFSSPLHLSTDINPDDYQILILKNHLLVENSIFQVYEAAANIRIGWIFPVQALASTDHNEASNIHFLRYATAALFTLLSPAENFSTTNGDILHTGSIQLSDFYADDIAVLALSRQVINGLADFNINYYRHSLFKYGFVSHNANSHPSNTTGRTAILFSGLSVRINLRTISLNLRNDPFLSSLFEGHIDLRGHPLAAFLILYQIFELLIERVFQVERANLLANIQAIGNTVADAKLTVKRFQESISEENRLGILTSPQHLDPQPDWQGLRNSCNNFLNFYGAAASQHLNQFLYPVRNRIVHEFRSVTAPALAFLNEINSELLVLLPDLVTNYKD